MGESSRFLGIRGRVVTSFGIAAVVLPAVFVLPVVLASAQSVSSQSVSTAPEAEKLDEIVVTAQKRLENLQDVPISVQVVSSQTLAQNNYNSLEELTETTAGVHVATGHLSNTLFIRGVGSGDNASFDQSVATFSDDIYHGRSRMSGATFLDLDHIELLKGPQSTFFGNNAIAGALNIVTKKPGDEFDAWGRALYGMFGQYAFEGAVGGPVTDTLGIRAAVTRNGESGWIENLSTGRDAPDENNEAGRLTFVYKPVEDLDATMKIEGAKHSLSGTTLQFGTACNPATASYKPVDCSIALSLPPGVTPQGFEGNDTAGIAGQGDSLSSFEDTLTVNYRKWGQTFTSVSGFYNYHFEASHGGALPVPTITEYFPEKYHQFSQELRIASSTDQAVQYLAGVYFQTDRLDTPLDATAFYVTPLIQFLAGGPDPALAPLVPYLPLGVGVDSTQSEEIYSAFGSVHWNITDALKLNGGLRATWDKKDFDGSLQYGKGTQTYGGLALLPQSLQPLAALLDGSPGTQTLSRTDHALMPSAGLQYQLSADAMAYFSYTKGFKAGGFNGQFPASPPQMVEYGPEHVNAYELGLKSEWLDRTVLVNLDLFRSDYRGLQVAACILNPATGSCFTLVRNAAASRSQGVEFAAQWAVTEGLRLEADVTYLDSIYTDYPNAPGTTVQEASGVLFGSVSGQATNFAPRWSGNISANYSMKIAGGYRFTTQLSTFATSRYNVSSNDDAFFAVAGYARLDSRLSLETPEGRWAFDVIGKNLADRVIVSNPGVFAGSKEQPRNVAAQFRYRFR